MSKTNEPLQPFAVPVTDESGQGFIVFVLADPASMAMLAQRGSVVMHAGSATPILSAQEYADQSNAQRELMAHLVDGGSLQ